MESLFMYLSPVLAVLLSYWFVLLTKASEGRQFAILLSFSGAFLLAQTIFELLPRVYPEQDFKFTGLCIMGGILLQIVLEFFSKGAEHGHIHHSNTNTLPWMLLVSLGIHAFLEGMAILPGEGIIYGIVIHKIPVAVILSIFLLKTLQRPGRVFMLIVLFSLMTPLGTAAALHIGALKELVVPITAVVIGILLHISTVILFESSEGHRFNYRKMAAILTGVVIAYFI